METNVVAMMFGARREAQNYFHSLVPPTKADNDWRFSSSIPEISFLDTVVEQPSYFRDLGDGAFVCDFDYFCMQYPELAQQYCFDQENKKNEQRYFSAYVQAYWNRAFVLFVPAGVQMKIPCLLGLQYCDSVVIEKLYVIVQPRASIVIHDYIEIDHTVHRLIVWHIGEHAQVTVVSDEKNCAGAFLLSSSRYFLGDSSMLTLYQSSSVLGYSTHWVDIFLAGRGAQMVVKAVAAVGGSGFSQMLTLQEHNACDTTSDVVVHAVAAGQAQVVYQGLIFIAEHALRVVAAQKNKTLLCSERAQAWSVPALQVCNNDVQCTHGSAISQWDVVQMWYLQSRGIEQKTAQNLLLQAFVVSLVHVQMHNFLQRMYDIMRLHGVSDVG